MTTRDPFWRTIAGAWVFASMILVLSTLSAIVERRFPDPDDILRLLEVRDLIDGQSWWDVTQYRLASGMMHWSRLVDLPLAAVILPLRLVLGEGAAERVALVAVPPVTLFSVMALVGFLTRRLIDEERAFWSLLLVPLSVPLVAQLRPMRIDHHGWQVVLALAALLAIVRAPSRRNGAIAGAMLALLLTVSLEGLPIAAILVGILALAWAIDPTRRGQLVAATATLAGTALLLHLATRGPIALTPACDAMAPSWLAALVVGAVGSAAVTALPVRTLPLRLAGLTLVGIAAGGAALVLDPSCIAGPFGKLDPIVRALWYEQVSEGLPVWEQGRTWAVMCVGLPLLGLVGGALALREAGDGRRQAWWIALAAAAGAFVVSLLVSRSSATANAFAAPGAAWAVHHLLLRARRVPRVPLRIAATAGVLLVAAPGSALLPLTGMQDSTAVTLAKNLPKGRRACTGNADTDALQQIPAARLFAPIDIAPQIIVSTHHTAIASGHHRNARAMHDVLAAFTGSSDSAHGYVRQYGAEYLVGCPGMPETGLYDRVAPQGLWARLERGEQVSWLRPVELRGSNLLVWKVVNAADRPLPSEPAHP